MKYGIQVKSVIERMQSANDSKVPCIFIHGASLAIMESFSLDLATAIEDNLSIRFKGIVKHFTIKMPFISDREEANVFIDRFKESVSIARDCYDTFWGLVLVELDKEWCERGINPAFNCLPVFIRNNPQICFIVLAEGSGDSKYLNDIYSELKNSALWIQLSPKEPVLEHSVSFLQSMAADLGYSVSAKARTLLPQLLEEADTSNYDINHIVQQMLMQIDLDRHVNKDSNKIIKAADIKGVPKTKCEKQEVRIGFCGRYIEEE